MSMQMHKSFTSVQQDELTHIKNLGRGGFGIVTLQRHKRWGKVAVKQVIEKKVTHETKEAFYREAGQMLDVLTSQYVVSVMGMVEARDGGISIIMEYMEYGNLKHFTPLYLVTMETSPNPGDHDVFRSDCWPRRMLMICEMIKGMNFLHTLPQPIFHRDLKLENVFVGAGFRVKIGDLGLAVSRVSRSAQCNRGAAGTTTHLPPEVLTGDVSKATEAWDGYSFGITLFEFVTLTPDNSHDIPWPQFANDGLMYLWVKNNKRPDTELVLEDTPEVVVDTMKKCWDADCTKRPSFQDLQQRFVALYEKKYESSIRSADIQINVNISRHEQEAKEEEAMHIPTGLTPNSSPGTSPGAIHDIHGGPSERTTKKPIQNVSTSDGPSPANSAGSSGTSQGSTHPPIMVQSHTRPPAASGSQSSSNENHATPLGGSTEAQVTQPTGGTTQPSQTAAAAASTPEGPVPASASLSPDGETVSPDRSISPLKSMPQHAATGSGRVSGQEGQRMHQQPDWEAARRLEEEKSGSTDLPGQRSPDDPQIPQLTSTVPPYGGDQRWQQSNGQRTYDAGTTCFSSSTNMPQQATPSNGSQDDYDIPLKVDLPKNGQHMTYNVDQTVEEICKPFQHMNLLGDALYRQHQSYQPHQPKCNTEATDKHLMDLIGKLDPDELKKLYNHLGMSGRDVYKAEIAANSHDVDLMALSVLRRWRKQIGSSTTCEMILEALLFCECVDAKEELVEEWNLRDFSDQGEPLVRRSPRVEGPHGDVPLRRCQQNDVMALPMQEIYQGAIPTGRMLVSSASVSNLYQEMNRGPSSRSPQRALTVPQVRTRSLSPNFRRPTPLAADVGQDRPITEQDITRIDRGVGMQYRDLGRQLRLGDVEIQVIEADHRSFGTKEIAHQVLLKWINRHGRRATKSVLIRALRNVDLAKLCYKIP